MTKKAADPPYTPRVRQADFARMMGVSRTAVYKWVQEGKIDVGPDGRLDPRKAAESVVKRSDPTRLRARALRPLVADGEALQREAERARAEAEEARKLVAYHSALVDEADGALEIFMGELASEWARLAGCTPEEARAHLDERHDAALIAYDDRRQQGQRAPTADALAGFDAAMQRLTQQDR